MGTTHTNPIPVKPLLESFCVFLIYGLLIGAGFGLGSAAKFDLTTVQKWMVEPLSFYAFFAMSLLGLMGLGVTNLAFARTPESMHISPWAIGFWVPISNAGLSAGFIATGMSLGLAGGLLPWTFRDTEVRHLALLLLVISAVMLAFLVPLTLLKRWMFTQTRTEERISTLTGCAYCLSAAVLYLFIDEEAFYRFATGLFFTSLLGVGLALRQKKRLNRHS